jgi:dihydrofolate reductase
MITSIIVAMSENRVIGRDGDLPWRLTADMRRFRTLTMDHHLVLGRRTYESLDGPLPGRKLVVVSRSLEFPPAGAALVRTLPEALDLARGAGEAEVFIGGGSGIYEEAIGVANRMYLTLVHTQIEGDVFFPKYDRNQWKEAWTESFPADEMNQYPYSFKILERAALDLPPL